MPIQERKLTLFPWSEQADPESFRPDPLRAFTGIVWGALLGGAFWLMALALVLTG